MDEKIAEVTSKLGQLKERASPYKIDGVDIMKGSTLNINIIDGSFDDTFFDASKFQPMIQVIINEQQGDEQLEHTKVIQPPLNMDPVWKEVLSFDITKPEDEVAI